jgi:hypothetical protein
MPAVSKAENQVTWNHFFFADGLQSTVNRLNISPDGAVRRWSNGQTGNCRL